MTPVASVHSAVEYLQTRRPWLALYNVRLHPKPTATVDEVGMYELQQATNEIVQSLSVVSGTLPHTVSTRRDNSHHAQILK